MLVWCGGTLTISVIMDKKRNYVAPEVEAAVNIDVTVGVQMASGNPKDNPDPFEPEPEPED